MVYTLYMYRIPRKGRLKLLSSRESRILLLYYEEEGCFFVNEGVILTHRPFLLLQLA